jgi:hypothetical protein
LFFSPFAFLSQFGLVQEKTEKVETRKQSRLCRLLFLSIWIGPRKIYETNNPEKKIYIYMKIFPTGIHLRCTIPLCINILLNKNLREVSISSSVTSDSLEAPAVCSLYCRPLLFFIRILVCYCLAVLIS